MKVLVIGVDAASPGVLASLFADDRLPTLEGLFEAGATGELESHVPPWTPSMWPSIYTGVNPGKHGVFSFLSYDGYDWDVVDATGVREHALWEVLDEAGHSSVVVNVPVTHPPGSFDGALVPGYTAPEPPEGHPEGVVDEIEDAIGEYRIYGEETDDREAALEEYRSLARMRGEAFRHLADEYDPDFGFLQFQVTDTVFHEHPGDMGLVGGVYEAVDEQIEATLDACDPDAVFVVSDHGIGEYEGYGFAINEFLARHGFVETTVEAGDMPSWVPVREGRLRENGDDAGDGGGTTAGVRDQALSAVGGAASRTLSAAGRVGLTTRRVGAVLEKAGLRDAAAERLPDDVIRAGQPQVDFAASTAYVRARIELGVRINLEGREPDGVVPPEEYDRTRAELVDLLRDVETPDGNPVFEEVVPREEYFDGPYADEAVDVVTVPADFDHFLTADLRDDLFADPGQPWNHKRTGVVAAAGDPIDPAPLPDAHLFDVAPTVLAAMDVPVSDRMDGRVLPVVEPSGERSYPAYEETASATDRGAVADRLENLGYIDG
jgi:predicted AlkP superfamily phosphohydrolase/phosphomutase